MLVRKHQAQFHIEGSIKDWEDFANNTWESDTFDLLDKILKPGQTIIDMGAWIGPISLYSATKVDKCYSFEPDPIAFKEFTNNLSLNPDLQKKIVPYNMAVTVDGQRVNLFSRYEYGDSGSSLLKRVKSRNSSVEVESITFNDFITSKVKERIDFIKMDVEGSEFFLLPSMIGYLRKHRPILLVSFHHTALCEYFESHYLPHGILRRIYRFLDPQKKWIKQRANSTMTHLLRSLDFYSIQTADSIEVSINDLIKQGLDRIDMLVFKPIQ